MTRTFVALVINAFLLAAFIPAMAAEKVGIRQSDVAEKPTAYCEVIKEPDPILLGGWEGVHIHEWKGKTGHDPVGFFLKKTGDHYAIYFFRSKERGGDRIRRGWRKFTINGNLIDSGTGVRIFAENGEVFFSYERGMKEKPTKLTRIPGSENW